MHSLYKQEGLPYLSVKCCPSCNKLVKVEHPTCPYCSWSFAKKGKASTPTNEVKRTEVRPTPVNQNTSTMTISSNQNTTQATIICPKCGNKTASGKQFCGTCGHKISPNLCSKCGQYVDSRLSYCPNCGERMKQTSVSQPQDVNTNDSTNTSIFESAAVKPIIDSIARSGETSTINVIQQTPEGEKTQTIQVSTENGNVKTTILDTSSVPAEEKPLEEIVNIGRKRLFSILQFVIVCLFATILVVVPILTNESLFKAIGDSFKGTLTTPLISGKSLVTSFTNLTAMDNTLLSVDGKYIFTEMIMPIIQKMSIDINDEGAKIVSIVAIMTVYSFILITMVIAVVTSIVGLFSTKLYYGKVMGVLTIAFAYGCLVIYLCRFFAPFKGYDSWLLYAFIITFVYWFVVKLVFLKEASAYKKAKKKLKANA